MKIVVFSKKKLFYIIPMTLLFFFIYIFFTTKELTYSASTTSINEFIPKLINQKEKVAYLTFDDGPSLVTPKILDILEKQNVKATFFVIGKNVEKHPETVKRAFEEGHYIANHTYSHNNSYLYKSSQNFVEELKNTDLAIRKSYWSRRLLFLCFSLS